MSIILSVFLILLLYFIPGFALSRLVTGRARNSFWLWLLFSYLTVPFIYVLLAYLNQVNLIFFVGIVGLLLILILILRLKRESLPNLDRVLTSQTSFTQGGLTKILSVLVLGLFFLSLISPRFGLWKGEVPVGDDKPRVGQVVSVALSPQLPLHFRLPTTEMSIYYYHMVQPGLLVRFSDNFVKANQAWVVHLAFTYLLFVWFINTIATYFARSSLERLVMTLGLTFYSGLEYYLSRFRNVDLRHLEWWTDWLGPQFSIHMQLSSPYTSAFWVTQHAFSAFLVFLIYFLISSEEVKKPTVFFLIALIMAAILGSSAFVFMALAIAYALYYLIRLSLRRENFVEIVRRNLIILVVIFILSVGIVSIFASSGKENYFLVHLNSFHILPNQGINKLLNLLVTIPFYQFVEQSFLILVYWYYLYLFLKRREYLDKKLFLYLLTLPLWLIFIFRAKGDNNFSMRVTLPALVVLAIFFGWFVGDLWRKLTDRSWSKKVLAILLTLGSISLLPSTIWEFRGRFNDQFFESDKIYAKLDAKLPLRSIIFVDLPGEREMYDNIGHLAHRFTFKPVSAFNITDNEYTSQIAKEKYDVYTFSDPADVRRLISNEPRLKEFSLYYLGRREVSDFKKIEQIGHYWFHAID